MEFASGHDDRALVLAESAIERLEPLGDGRELAFALRILGWLGWRRGEAREAEPVLRRAAEMATRVHATVTLANATLDLGVTLSMLGRRDDCLRTTEEAFRLSKACSDFTVLGRAYVNYPDLIMRWTSDFGRAREITAEGVELARKAGASQLLGWLVGNLSDMTYLELGPLDRALELAREAVELGESIGDEPLHDMRLGSLGLLLIERGEIDEARRLLDRAAAQMTADPEPQTEIILRSGLGLLAFQQHDHVEAAAQLRVAVQTARGLNDDAEPEAYPPLVRSLLALGERDAAASYRDLDRAVSPLGIALGLVVDGLLAPEPAEAVRTLTEAVERLSDLPAMPELGRALLDLATAQANAGVDPTRTLARAREVFTESQALGWLSYVDTAEAALAGSPAIERAPDIDGTPTGGLRGP